MSQGCQHRAEYRCHRICRAGRLLRKNRIQLLPTVSSRRTCYRCFCRYEYVPERDDCNLGQNFRIRYSYRLSRCDRERCQRPYYKQSNTLRRCRSRLPSCDREHCHWFHHIHILREMCRLHRTKSADAQASLCHRAFPSH